MSTNPTNTQLRPTSECHESGLGLQLPVEECGSGRREEGRMYK